MKISLTERSSRSNARSSGRESALTDLSDSTPSRHAGNPRSSLNDACVSRSSGHESALTDPSISTPGRHAANPRSSLNDACVSRSSGRESALTDLSDSTPSRHAGNPRSSLNDACVLECGGKQSATPLSVNSTFNTQNSSFGETASTPSARSSGHESALNDCSRFKAPTLSPRHSIATAGQRSCRAVAERRRVNSSTRLAGFTMMEIAISLAIIGIALVAIIGVLPIGMNVQQDNRQQTVIAQDASVLMDAIRNGQLGLDDLTNYIYAISNNWGHYESLSAGGVTNHLGINGYTYSSFFVNPQYTPTQLGTTPNGAQITNAANIIGLMSTPEFTDDFGNPTNNLFSGGYSNHVVAYVYSMSGLSVEKPPQDNSLMRQDTFGYRVFCVNAPFAVTTNGAVANSISLIEQQMANNLHELRLTFLWPQQANGSLGAGRQTFRTMVAGQMGRQPPLNPINSSSSIWYNTNFYYYQPQWFTNAL